ncbi:uncharacterized protein LOC125608596 [Brassica napus]|uniref:uncharacterized protein LOC125608596 n=1 Tax=Brassica napus TaxID=3708 RepID=UPI0020784E13|nr:uncharacterized protein LOC125608596 [Brassica napus]
MVKDPIVTTGSGGKKVKIDNHHTAIGEETKMDFVRTRESDLGCLKMDLPELPPRMFTLGEEPDAIRSISYHSDDTKLFKALYDCLTADEYEELKASKLGVFIKFKELEFLDIKKKFELWSLVASQHARFSLIEFEYLTGLNCDYIKDLENSRCEVTKEMAAFWEKMRVDLDTGPRYIEGKKFSSATPASLARLAKDLTQTGYTVDGFIQVLQVWAYYAMPELGANFGSPIPNRPSPLLLAYKAGKRQRKCFKAAMKKQTIVKNFVQKDFDEMFPKWDGDWTMNCWQVTGTRKVVKMEVSSGKNEVSPVKTEKTTMKSESVVKEESSRPRKKARKGSSVSAETLSAGSEGIGMTKQIERVLKDISDAISDGFGTCLREIKLLGDRMVAVEKKVGITKKGGSYDDRQLTTTSNPPKPVHEPGSESVNGAKAGQKEAKEPSLTTDSNDLPSDDPSVLILDKQVSTTSDLLVEEARRQTKKETAMVNLCEKSVRERKLAPTQQTPFKGNSTAKQIIPNKKVGRGYDPFAPYDKRKSKELTAWVQQDP